MDLNGKYNHLFSRTLEMLSVQSRLRPNCDNLLEDKMKWARIIDKTEIIGNYGKYMENNFYRIFLSEMLT